MQYINSALTYTYLCAVAKARKMCSDQGMSTIEYAFGSLAAAALAGVLYLVVNGDAVTNAIEGVITDALSNTPG